MLCFIDVIHRSYTKSYNIQSFFDPDVGVIFEKSILSSSHKLVDEESAGILDPYYGKKKTEKYKE